MTATLYWNSRLKPTLKAHFTASTRLQVVRENFAIFSNVRESACMNEYFHPFCTPSSTSSIILCECWIYIFAGSRNRTMENILKCPTSPVSSFFADTNKKLLRMELARWKIAITVWQKRCYLEMRFFQTIPTRYTFEYSNRCTVCREMESLYIRRSVSRNKANTIKAR